MHCPQRSILVIAIAAGAALWPSAAAAQVDLAPTLGTYLPLGGWTQVSDGGTGFAPKRRQLAAHLMGARLTAWASSRLGLEGSVAFSPSQVAVSTDGNTTDISGGVVLASARALFKVATLVDGHPEDQTHWDIIVGAGAGMVHRSGSAWENTSGVTAPALVFTGAVRTRLAGPLSWRVSLEDFVSWAQFDKGLASQTRGKVHHDLVGSLAVVVRLAGR